MANRCLDCFYYKTRVFRDEEELIDRFVVLSQCNRSYLWDAKRILKRTGKVRVWWCSAMGRGPYLEEKQILKNCNKIKV